MKYLIQLIIAGIVLWISTMLFPSIVIIDSTKTFILTTIAYSVITAFLAIVFVNTLLILIAEGEVIITIILACLLSIIVSYLSLLAAETYISGFQIIGIAPRLIIAVIAATATIRIATEKHSEL